MAQPFPEMRVEAEPDSIRMLHWVVQARPRVGSVLLRSPRLDHSRFIAGLRTLNHQVAVLLPEVLHVLPRPVSSSPV